MFKIYCLKYILMMILTIIPAGRWPRRASPVPKNTLFKIYFKQYILKSFLTYQVFFVIFFFLKKRSKDQIASSLHSVGIDTYL